VSTRYRQFEIGLTSGDQHNYLNATPGAYIEIRNDGWVVIHDDDNTADRWIPTGRIDWIDVETTTLITTTEHPAHPVITDRDKLPGPCGRVSDGDGLGQWVCVLSNGHHGYHRDEYGALFDDLGTEAGAECPRTHTRGTRTHYCRMPDGHPDNHGDTMVTWA
jgi:hypothetical protein